MVHRALARGLEGEGIRWVQSNGSVLDPGSWGLRHPTAVPSQAGVWRHVPGAVRAVYEGSVCVSRGRYACLEGYSTEISDAP